MRNRLREAIKKNMMDIVQSSDTPPHRLVWSLFGAPPPPTVVGTFGHKKFEIKKAISDSILINQKVEFF